MCVNGFFLRQLSLIEYDRDNIDTISYIQPGKDNLLDSCFKSDE